MTIDDLERATQKAQRNVRLWAALPVTALKNVKIKFAMESIRTGLRRVMSDFLKTQPQEEAAALAWPMVCGAEIASRTKALVFSDGRLTIEVPDANWRNQLSAFSSRYLAGLDEILPDVVKDIKFQVKGAWPSEQGGSRDSQII